MQSGRHLSRYPDESGMVWPKSILGAYSPKQVGPGSAALPSQVEIGAEGTDSEGGGCTGGGINAVGLWVYYPRRNADACDAPAFA